MCIRTAQRLRNIGRFAYRTYDRRPKRRGWNPCYPLIRRELPF